MEDGCSKRFDIGTLDLRADAYDGMHPGARAMAPMGHMIPPPGGLPPMAIPPLCGTSMLGSLAPTRDHTHSHAWGR